MTVSRLADLYNWPRIFSVSGGLLAAPLMGYAGYGAAMIRAGKVGAGFGNQLIVWSALAVALGLMLVSLVATIRSTSAANPVTLARRKALASVSATCLGNGRAMSLLEQLTNVLESNEPPDTQQFTAEQLLAMLRDVTLREAAQSILGKTSSAPR